MDLSFLLPVSNHLDLTRECLGSLERTVRGLRWEAVIVDDGSTDGTGEFLRALAAASPARYRIAAAVPGGAPRGPAACFNTAARLARAPLLCTLSPAAVLMPGWLAPMRRLAARRPAGCCVGNVHREPISGLIEYTGFLFGVDGLPADAGRSTTAPPREPHTRWPAVSMACCLLPAQLYRLLDGFDEDLPLELAGIDFCLRAAEKHGTRHYTANRSVIYLHTEIPMEEPPALGQRIFEERWGRRAAAYQQWEQRQAAAEAELMRRTAGGRAAPAEAEIPAEHWEDFCRSRDRLWHRRWELAREARRQWRQDIVDKREDGWRYLRKHLLRPWRYNYYRLGQALVQATHPLPPAMPKPPPYPQLRKPRELLNGAVIEEAPELGHPDGDLFNPSAH